MFNDHPVMSLLDTDLYKFTMLQFILHQFPTANVKFKFKCRTPNINLAKYGDEVANEIRYVSTLKFQPNELEYLSKLRYLTNDYIEFLTDFKLKSKHVSVRSNSRTGELIIEITGPWLQTILWEIPILKIVHEVYSRREHKRISATDGFSRLYDKRDILAAEDITIIDFGSRRAFSSQWHDAVVENLRDYLKGTSNVMLAMHHNLTPIGTMAHEVFQACQGMTMRPHLSQRLALDKWSQEYRGDLGIALTDTLGIDRFLKDFDMYYAKLFDGVRHDSGDPLTWASKMLYHYEKLGIDPLTKSYVFSDGLDIPQAIKIRKLMQGIAGNNVKVAFGIGTNLTNDLGYKALQIVIKMVECNGYPVAKISDSPGKLMCEDPKYVERLKKEILQ